jgi:hypothetical protein
MCGGRAPALGTRNLSRPLCVSVYVVAAERTQHNALRYDLRWVFLFLPDADLFFTPFFGFRALFVFFFCFLDNPRDREARPRGHADAHGSVARCVVDRCAFRRSRVATVPRGGGVRFTFAHAFPFAWAMTLVTFAKLQINFVHLHVRRRGVSCLLSALSSRRPERAREM